MSLPIIETDPYGERMRLERCHVGRPLTPVDENAVLSELGSDSAAWSLLRKLEGVTVEHGRTESITCYRGHRLGGIDRVKGHWFVSATLATATVDKFLRKLDFLSRSSRYGSALPHWYQLDVAHGRKFEHAVAELSKAIDRHVAGGA